MQRNIVLNVYLSYVIVYLIAMGVLYVAVYQSSDKITIYSANIMKPLFQNSDNIILCNDNIMKPLYENRDIIILYSDNIMKP